MIQEKNILLPSAVGHCRVLNKNTASPGARCSPSSPLSNTLHLIYRNSAPSTTPNKETYYDRLSKWTGKPVDATIQGRCNLSLPDAAGGLARPDRDSTGGTSSA
uniref:Uncharacterized protein n=1 Tax=Trichuris muris TaxID=70415 RepID=A0A5S6QB48_TRIMR